MYINRRYGSSGEPSGVESCRKFEKATQTDWNGSSSNKKATKMLQTFTNTNLTLLLLCFYT